MHQAVFSVCGYVNVSLLYFQGLVYDCAGHNLEIELFDEDTDKDDFLGRYRPQKLLFTRTSTALGFSLSAIHNWQCKKKKNR